jgi:hypothetical protein
MTRLYQNDHLNQIRLELVFHLEPCVGGHNDGSALQSKVNLEEDLVVPGLLIGSQQAASLLAIREGGGVVDFLWVF